MKRESIRIIFLVSAILLMPQGGPLAASTSTVVDRVVAVVDEEIITMSDLQREAARMQEKVDEHLLLEELINRKLQMTAAKRAGMDVTERELESAIDDVMKQNRMDAAAFSAALAKEGLTLEQYRAELKEQMTISRMFNKYVRTGLAVDEAEVRRFYEKNSAAFELPEEVRLRQIFLPASKNASRADVRALKARAERAAERARSGEDFAALVREYAGPAAGDGDLGFLQREHMAPEILEAVAKLAAGDTAGPVKGPGGFHVIRVEDVRKRVRPFESVKEEISKFLFNQKLENTYQAWLQSLRGESHIENKL